jgi:hypothetical protein
MPGDFYSALDLADRYGTHSLTVNVWMRDVRVRFPAPADTVRGERLWRVADVLEWEKWCRGPAALHAPRKVRAVPSRWR